jgi:fido (protein-threonine AMPylation protein)
MEALEDAIEAWNYAYLNRDKIDHTYLLEVHRLLCQRIHPDIAGKWRDCDVWIGGERKQFYNEEAIKGQFTVWLKKSKITKRLRENPEQVKDHKAQKWHVEFEKIHGFCDGNGRLGRILWNVQRLLLGLPLLVIDSRTKNWEYYNLFKD